MPPRGAPSRAPGRRCWWEDSNAGEQAHSCASRSSARSTASPILCSTPCRRCSRAPRGSPTCSMAARSGIRSTRRSSPFPSGGGRSASSSTWRASFSRSARFHGAADLATAVGLGGAALAAVAGLADWSLTNDKARRVGLVHALVNTAVVGLYGASMALAIDRAPRASAWRSRPSASASSASAAGSAESSRFATAVGVRKVARRSGPGRRGRPHRPRRRRRAHPAMAPG